MGRHLHADEAGQREGALHLGEALGGAVGRRHGQRAHAVRVVGDVGGQQVVDLLAQVERQPALEDGDAQDGEVDAGPVHVLDAQGRVVLVLGVVEVLVALGLGDDDLLEVGAGHRRDVGVLALLLGHAGEERVAQVDVGEQVLGEPVHVGVDDHVSLAEKSMVIGMCAVMTPSDYVSEFVYEVKTA